MNFNKTQPSHTKGWLENPGDRQWFVCKKSRKVERFFLLQNKFFIWYDRTQNFIFRSLSKSIQDNKPGQ